MEEATIDTLKTTFNRSLNPQGFCSDNQCDNPGQINVAMDCW